ncbi:hypothetical protein [Legionella maioricensis]|uniref:Uncharacterized protein n=1 Tax=Legionella maioricensis TaxID=2896528 RepID=A0A9X2IDK6_9GAMM|nr:hypothetical protein [Legionella maioricensis]MCL9684878.1 hypothetical protein [Legionella maioricensis]MCL9688954.1 hypothetical protein [Legionella maioricensis]
MNEKKEFIESTILIQSLIRRYEIQKKYKFTSLPEESMVSYQAFLLGNDPLVNVPDRYVPNQGGVALVAVSGFRALQLACKLGEKDKSTMPRVFIVDISKQVHVVWKMLKECADKSTTATAFLANLDHFLKDAAGQYRNIQQYACTCTDCEPKPNPDPLVFFGELITMYGYDYVSEIITHTVLIKNSFADRETFKKIKEHISNLGISNTFVYSSNVLTDIYWIGIKNRPLVNIILENIQFLDPNISIHTNLCRKHWEPKNVYLMENQSPELVRSILKINPQKNVLMTPDSGAQVRVGTQFSTPQSMESKKEGQEINSEFSP